MWNPFRRFTGGLSSEEEFARQRAELLAKAPIPCIWMLGKTGSGKSSIIRQLTGASEAVVGNGFRPQTRCSRMFSFPDDESPIVRFLDTRGFGEAEYDPAEDIATLDKQAHLLIVTVRATDQAADAVIAPLKQIRRANPNRPVLLAVTCLHDAYPGRPHPEADPFASEAESPAANGQHRKHGLAIPDSLPEDLRKCLTAHVERFAGLADRVVPIDFTLPEDRLEPPDLGAARLKQAILELLPAAYRQTLLQMHELQKSLGEMHDRRALPIILGYSALAGTAGAVPVPWIDVPIVIGIQSQLIRRLAKIYNQPLDKKVLSQVGGAVGGRIALTMLLRETLKFIPWVGMAANAAASFAWVYASGRAWNWYFQQIRAGHIPDERELEQIYRKQLQVGAHLWRDTRQGAAS